VEEPLLGEVLSSLTFLTPLWNLNTFPACEAAKKVVWLKKFLRGLGVMRIQQTPIMLFCDNSGVVAKSKEP